ncbi:MAG TPA: aspartate aminotransferase family protein, partial [Actinomycetota bacterium]|nr:aspartate aminotransferase family protein [Actinomycetota bacterium]
MGRPELDDVVRYAQEWLSALPERRVGWTASGDDLRAALDGRLPDGPSEPSEVIGKLIADADPGTVGTTSPRYFGFVIGGSTPASLAADWLASLWDQNAGLFVAGPAASVVEEVSGRWLVELLGLPEACSYGFVTGGQMANFTGLAVARHDVLERIGWDVERRGLQGSPRLRVIVGEERHSTI